MPKHMLALAPRHMLALALAAAMFAIGMESSAGEIPDSNRPRIGLALSGGTARGLAHIGVLRELEEIGIRPDFIAGTSMGAVVGGLYSLGLSANEVEELMLSLDWADLFSDRPVRSRRSFRRKEEDRASLIDFEFGLRHWTLSLPQSFVGGRKLAVAFPLPTLYTSQPDFDHLPIPFRAVATDIETGEMVIISRGTVVQAMRASIAIPGVFSPASVDGRLLVDGGIVRNLPVDVVRDMGADIVIAVNVSMPVRPEESDPFGSVSGILAQSVTLATQDNIAEQKALADLVIEPDLRKIGRLRFDRAGEIVQRGRDATSALAPELRRYADASDSNRAAHAPLPASGTIDSVEIVNHSKIATQVIRRSLHIRLGEELDWEALRVDLSRVHEFGLTERVDLEFVKDGPLTILRLEAQKKTQPTVVRFGFTFSDDVEQNTRFDLHARVTSRELNRLGAESRNDLALGTNRLVRSEWYQPLEYSRTLFVVPSARYEKSPDDFYRGDRRIAQYETEIQSARLEAGLQIGRFGEVRTGFELGHVKSTIATGSDSLPQWDTARSMLTAGATIDMLDDASFPTSGGIGTWTWRGARKIAGGDLVYERTEAILALFRSSGRTTVFWTGRAGTDLDSNAPVFEQFSLGGLRSMSGYHEDELRGPVLTTARLGAFRSIYSISQVFRSQVYLGAWLDAGNVWATADKARLDELRYSGSVFVGIDAPVGPVYLTYGRTDDGRDAAYLTIGLKLTDGES